MKYSPDDLINLPFYAVPEAKFHPFIICDVREGVDLAVLLLYIPNGNSPNHGENSLDDMLMSDTL